MSYKEEHKEYVKKWKKENKGKVNSYAKKYREKYPEKSKAHLIAQKIKIPLNEKCELCKIKLAVERHHPNYNQPLEIMFLCVGCHNKIHSGGYCGN